MKKDVLKRKKDILKGKKMYWDVEEFLHWNETLEKIPRERLIEIDDELNNYGCWPAELEEVPPGQRERFRVGAWEWIKSEVGDKALMRYHHIHNLHRTEQEFDDWWAEQGAWWLWGSRARAELKEIITEALREESAEQVSEKAEEYTEKSAQKRADHDGNEFVAAILFALGFVLGTFLGVLL